jgi:hypothetical protein
MKVPNWAKSLTRLYNEQKKENQNFHNKRSNDVKENIKKYTEAGLIPPSNLPRSYTNNQL